MKGIYLVYFVGIPVYGIYLIFFTLSCVDQFEFLSGLELLYKCEL